MLCGLPLSPAPMCLDSGKLHKATQPGGRNRLPANLIQINRTYIDGRWTVELRAPLDNTEGRKLFIANNRCACGVALGRARFVGAKQWASLRVMLDLAGNGTDFKVE